MIIFLNIKRILCKHMHVCLFSRSVVSTCSPTGSSVHRIYQARILESVAISSSRESPQPRDQIHISCVSCIGRQILYHWATWEVMQIHAHTQMNLVAFFWASKYYEKWPWKNGPVCPMGATLWDSVRVLFLKAHCCQHGTSSLIDRMGLGVVRESVKKIIGILIHSFKNTDQAFNWHSWTLWWNQQTPNSLDPIQTHVAARLFNYRF